VKIGGEELTLVGLLELWLGGKVRHDANWGDGMFLR
jgi:hypothetical protein